MTLSSVTAVRISLVETEEQQGEHTLRSRSGGSGHFSSFQAFVIAEQTTGSVAATGYQRLGVFPRLANFNDILQLGFTNLCSGEF